MIPTSAVQMFNKLTEILNLLALSMRFQPHANALRLGVGGCLRQNWIRYAQVVLTAIPPVSWINVTPVATSGQKTSILDGIRPTQTRCEVLGKTTRDPHGSTSGLISYYGNHLIHLLQLYWCSSQPTRTRKNRRKNMKLLDNQHEINRPLAIWI